MTSTLRINAANTARTKPTTGDTKMSFVNTDHLGWLKCDGRAMDKTADNLLFQVIGYSFGGSGNTFNLPNPAGRVLGTVGTVNDGNVDDPRSHTFTAGQVVGEIDHKLVQSEMPSHNHMYNGTQYTDSPVTGNVNGITSPNGGHTHTITDPGHTHSYTSPASENISVQISSQSHSSATTAGTTGLRTTGITIDAVADHTHTIHSNGGDMYHNNMQPTLFYGNTFIYCGVPMRGEFPFKTGLAPVLI
jgi:microcystin-dependent protein